MHTRMCPTFTIRTSIEPSSRTDSTGPFPCRCIPVGTAYAVWIGIGATGTAIYGMLNRPRAVHFVQGLDLYTAGATTSENSPAEACMRSVSNQLAASRKRLVHLMVIFKINTQ